MAAEESASAEARAEAKPEPEPFWASFNDTDVKLFVVTFAGTLAAGVLTVVIVGLGLLVIRVARDQGLGPREAWVFAGPGPWLVPRLARLR